MKKIIKDFINYIMATRNIPDVIVLLGFILVFGAGLILGFIINL